MDKKLIKKMIMLVMRYNPKTRMAGVKIVTSDRGVLLVVHGVDARYMSNALYHMMRALGRRRVRRWVCGSDWCVSFY
jgi:hypothetical protein